MTPPTALERAFELARSGEFGSVEQIRARLKVEGYDPRHVQGKALTKQLKGIIADSRRLNNATVKAPYIGPAKDE